MSVPAVGAAATGEWRWIRIAHPSAVVRLKTKVHPKRGGAGSGCRDAVARSPEAWSAEEEGVYFREVLPSGSSWWK